jgi:hypothetical protein
MNRLLFCFAIIIFTVSSITAQNKEAYKFEELVAGNCEAAWSIIDQYVGEIRKDSAAKGYIIFYGGKTYDFYEKPKTRLPKRGEAEFRARIAESRLKWLGEDLNRYVVVNGGYREKFTFEFWVVPAGAETPKPTPTIEADEIKYRKGKPKGDLWGC